MLVLDDVPEELDELRGALRRRYGLEYVVICESSAAAASDRLARLAADGRPVAIVCASAAMIDTGGGGVLAMAHRLYPAAKRVLIVPGEVLRRPVCASLRRCCTTSRWRNRCCAR
jgi:DNA-binding transcriptional regulator LsrR (DeoR family)